MLIYLVEDDPNIRDLVLYTLRATGYEAKGFGDAKPFWEAMQKQYPVLLLLDIMLPGEDGLSILSRLRENEGTKNLPIIMLTAKTSEHDKVAGLDGGADDYLAKPFGMMELVSRIKAVLRRSTVLVTQPREEEGTILQQAGITLDPVKHTVTVKEAPVQLTLKEFEMLQLLMQHIGVVFTRDQLLKQVWGYSFQGGTRTIDVHVRSLRMKLGEEGTVIETVRGVGYRIGEI